MDIGILLGIKPPLCAPRGRVVERLQIEADEPDEPEPVKVVIEPKLSQRERRNILIECMRNTGPEVMREIAKLCDIREGLVRADLEEMQISGEVSSRKFGSYTIWWARVRG